MDGGHCVPVKCGYRLPVDNRVGFELHGYRGDGPLVKDLRLELAATLGGVAAGVLESR